MNKKYKNLIKPALITLLLLVIMIGSVAAYNMYSVDTDTETKPTRVTQDSNNQKLTEDEEIVKDYISYTANTNGTALDQLTKLNSTVITEDSEYGKLIISINGLKGGSDGKYWSFYIDGEMAQVGADTFKPAGGELIEWKFQAL